ncbi:hypothetical protein BH10ACT7_BH10ACT7_11010 [soil metagenome]
MNYQTKPIRDTALRVPDQTEKARELIDDALALWNGESIGTALARVIAASVHAGPDTALGRFAGGGELDVDQALTELHSIPKGEIHFLWRGVLAGYLHEQRGGTDD